MRIALLAIAFFIAASSCAAQILVAPKHLPIIPVCPPPDCNDEKIVMLTAFPVGGTADIVTRQVALKLNEILKKPAVVDSRPGRNGVVAAAIVAKAKPNGSTLLIADHSLTIASSVHANLPYDLARDLEPVGVIASTPMALLVHPSIAASSPRELLALAKASPDKLTYASAGVGSISHLTGELFNQVAGTKMLHVPYKGTGASLADLVAGQVQVSFMTPQAALPYINSGRLRVLGVTTTERSPLLPAVPTFSESGLSGLDAKFWIGAYYPAKTPREIVGRMNAMIGYAVTQPDSQRKLAAAGVRPDGGSPNQMQVLVRNDQAKWSKIVREAGIKRE